MADGCLSCTTFNILAPIYKRLDNENVVLDMWREQDQSCRESKDRERWFSRNERILDRLLFDRSSIICLQEFWVGNQELVDMYDKRLGDAGYVNFPLARTNNCGDGLLTSVRKDYFRVLNHRELLFNDSTDRVAQLLHVELVVPLWKSCNNNLHHQILIGNTHLLFPHDSCLSIVRLRQVYKILEDIELYQKEHELNPIPIILCGDWNGSKRGNVYKFLRSQGFVSSYDVAHQYTDSDADAHKWVSHRNHRGNICGVDFIWLLNPNQCRKPLMRSWNEAVFGNVKCHLLQASPAEENAFAFLKDDSLGDCITYSSLCQALRKLSLTGHPRGLGFEEIKNLWTEAAIDENGVVNYEEFKQRIWDRKWYVEPEDISKGRMDVKKNAEQLAMCFNVKNAVLLPPEVEKGMWPEDYSLSDHAQLTVVFSPQQIWDPTGSEESEEASEGRGMDIRENTEQIAMCSDLKNTVLFSPEVEKGM